MFTHLKLTVQAGLAPQILLPAMISGQTRGQIQNHI